jgi:hypothetical protein
VLGVLWASASRGATVRELRAAIGLTCERLEAAYAYMLEYPPLGLSVLRHGDELPQIDISQGIYGQAVDLNGDRFAISPRQVGARDRVPPGWSTASSCSSGRHDHSHTASE